MLSNQKENQAEYARIIAEADHAKHRMAEIAAKLEEIDCKRKAKSAMSIVYRIEEWQNK